MSIINSIYMRGYESEMIHCHAEAVLGTWSVLSVSCCVLVYTCLLWEDKIANFKNMTLVSEKADF